MIIELLVASTGEANPTLAQGLDVLGGDDRPHRRHSATCPRATLPADRGDQRSIAATLLEGAGSEHLMAGLGDGNVVFDADADAFPAIVNLWLSCWWCA